MNFIYLDRQSEFDALCMELMSEDALAVDTEFVRRKTYYPILALLQIASRSQIYLVDPQGINDWSKLVQLFQSRVRIVMHSCSEDLEVFRNAFNQLPENLFDTQIAAAYLGKGDAMGYAAMVSLMCGEELDKSETQSDWSQRPLTEAQLKYAAADVHWLLGITDRLDAELAEQQRSEWVSQELQTLMAKYLEEPATEDAWLRLKGLGRLDKQDWSLAQTLCAWREETARRRDKPKTWIMKDPELLEIIQRRPKSINELSQLSLVSPMSVRHHGKRLLELLASAESLTPPDVGPPPDLTGAERKLLKLMQKVVIDYAEEHRLAQRFIANKQELSQYILFHHSRSDVSSALDCGWRKQELGKQLEKLL